MNIDVAHVSKRFGGAPVLRDVSLAVPDGSIVALLGPSGCGKTTLLRLIAGLEQADEGEIRVGEKVLTGPGTHVPPERRQVGMVFQDWALFPHLSVGGNVAYGLTREERRHGRVEEALALVGLDGLGDRSPATLSGGQQQRVALARALAPRPIVLLLDEPFSNLDTTMRIEVRTEVHRLLTDLGITAVFVTHDQDEAFVLGDVVAVMRAGHIEQQASPSELYHSPASPWVAGFVGDANLVAGTASGALADTPIGTVGLSAPLDGPVDVLLRPEAVHLRPGAGAVVELVEFYGHDTVYDLVLDGGLHLRSRVGGVPRFVRGDRVEASYTGPPTSAWATSDAPAATATVTATGDTAPLTAREPAAARPAP